MLPICEAVTVEAGVRQLFPRGLHFKKIRGGSRKLKMLRLLTDALPDGDFFGAGHVQRTIDYGHQIYFGVLSGTCRKSAHEADLKMLVAGTPLRNGLVWAENVLPAKERQGLRLYTTYHHALTYPVPALARELQRPLELEVLAGVVGDPQRHMEQLVAMKADLARGTTELHES